MSGLEKIPFDQLKMSCKLCKTVKLIKEFGVARSGRISQVCLDCDDIRRREQERRYNSTPKRKLYLKDLKHRRRTLLKTGRVTLEEWTDIKKKQGYRCYWCGSLFEDSELTMDHLIALKNGGEHKAENIVAACQSCNSRKGTKGWRCGADEAKILIKKEELSEDELFALLERFLQKRES